MRKQRRSQLAVGTQLQRRHPTGRCAASRCDTCVFLAKDNTAGTDWRVEPCLEGQFPSSSYAQVVERRRWQSHILICTVERNGAASRKCSLLRQCGTIRIGGAIPISRGVNGGRSARF